MPLLDALATFFLGALEGFSALLGAVLRRSGLAIGFALFMVILFSLYMEIIRRKYLSGFPGTFLQVKVP